MTPTFDFGISQEDADVEISCLNIQDGDTLLSIASGGDVPLNILANKNVHIRAVDISLNQIYLSRLKCISSLTFDPEEGASFLGFLESDAKTRVTCLHKAARLMSDQEKAFWYSHVDLVEKGVIHTARFERYLSRFHSVALHLIGRAKLLKLMDQNSVAEQSSFFDNHFNVLLLRKLFGVIFSPHRYRNGAVSEQGFQNAGTGSTAEFFFSRFKAFCTATPARKNYYLQFYLFNKLLFRDALPDYLTEKGINRIRQNRDSIEFTHMSFSDALARGPVARYNKFHLSNLGDWMSPGAFGDLLVMIDANACRPFRILSRYLHRGHPIPVSLRQKMATVAGTDDALRAVDRFPFYNIMAISSL